MVDITRYDVINFFFVFGAIGVALYAWFVYGFLTQSVIPLGNTVTPQMKAAFQTEKGAIYTHALCSAVCLIIGPFQVIPSFRKNHILAHRRAGFVYFFFSVAGSVSAIICAQKAQGGATGRAGFTTLGVVWILSNIVGFVSMVFFKNRKIHELAMQISCALVYSAVSLRIMLPIAGSNFDYGYGIISWLCWVINLVVLAVVRCFMYYYNEENNDDNSENNNNNNNNDNITLSAADPKNQIEKDGEALIVAS